jgi:hypothetical protein
MIFLDTTYFINLYGYVKLFGLFFLVLSLWYCITAMHSKNPFGVCILFFICLTTGKLWNVSA